MLFDIVTIFPDIVESYFKEGLLSRAKGEGYLQVYTHDLRKFSTDEKHHKVDDRPFGGGPGMVVMVEPIEKAIENIKTNAPEIKTRNQRVILLSAKGKKFDQKEAKRLSKYKQLIFICGRYEGVDERVADYIADEEISIGDYILNGGEVGALVVIEAVSRYIAHVLHNEESIGSRPYPVYTRPEIFETKEGKKWRVPKVLLSGNHKKIDEWRRKNMYNV